MANAVKIQTVRKHWHERIAEPVVRMNEVVEAFRVAVVANGLENDIPQGELDAMLAVEAAIKSLAALPGITQSAGKVVPSHKGNAIIIIGVND